MVKTKKVIVEKNIEMDIPKKEMKKKGRPAKIKTPKEPVEMNVIKDKPKEEPPLQVDMPSNPPKEENEEVDFKNVKKGLMKEITRLMRIKKVSDETKEILKLMKDDKDNVNMEMKGNKLIVSLPITKKQLSNEGVKKLLEDTIKDVKYEAINIKMVDGLKRKL